MKRASVIDVLPIRMQKDFCGNEIEVEMPLADAFDDSL